MTRARHALAGGLTAIVIMITGSQAQGKTESPAVADRFSGDWTSRWDFATFGFTAGTGLYGNIQLMTVFWPKARLTLIDFNGGLTFNQVTLDWTIGWTIGLGGHHGGRSQYSHWFITGMWYGEMHLEPMLVAPVKYRGLFFPVGYEFRWNWGRKLHGVVGLRVHIAYSPLGEQSFSKCTDGFLCSNPTKGVKLPLTAGLTVFVGI
jgi:hypothetical protein